MNFSRSMSIRTQIIILIVLMALLPLSMIVYYAVQQQQHDIAEAFDTATLVATQIQNDQRILLAGADQLASAVSILPGVKQHDAATVSTTLAELIRSTPRILNISIMDRSGRIWASGLPVTNTPSYADRRFFINAVATGKPSSGEYTMGKTLNIPFITFGYPIKDITGAVSDVITILIPLDSYNNLYSGEHARPVSAILLTDHKGTILYSSTDSSLVGKQDRPDLFRQMAEEATEGSFEAVGILGVKRLYSYRAVTLNNETRPYMFIRTGLDKDHVLIKSRKGLLVSIGSVLPTMFLMLCLVIYISKRGILDKISALRDAIQRIASGELDIRVCDHVATADFGELGSAVDNMAHRLQQADEARRDSDNKYRELVENANAIILKWDTEGTVIYFNEFAESFFGFPSSEIVGRSLIGTIVPETESSGRDLVEMIRDITINPDAYVNNENENIRRNGERVWVSWTNHLLLDAGGNKTGILSVGQDITWRKTIEKELQRSEQRFRSFVENVNDVIFALTPAGEFSYVSPNWTDAFGYDVSETVGRPFAPFVHPDDVPGCVDFMQRVLGTGRKQSGVEYRVKRKDGSYVWYRANASPMQDPVTNSLTLLGIGRDITEMKQVEETLRQSEERFSAAFHASPDAISLSRLGNGIYLDVNEGFTVLTGYQADEAIGKSAIELNLWGSHLDRVQLLLELRESGTVTGKELHFRRKDGSKRVGQMAARVIEINNEPYLLAIIRDVTEHEHLQNELIKAQKLESISVLAGGIAHNFNNVLTGVIGYISYAKKHLGETDKALQTLEAAEKASYRAAGIARQLLAFSQSGVPVRRPVSLDELIKESVALFLSGSKVKGVVDCPLHQTISVDSQQISQAFNNIVLNALQAMPEGGTLTVTSENIALDEINRYKLTPDNYARIEFRDTGCGISHEDLDKVYDPYFTTKESGTGLGLSTCHTIVTKHGGYIGITSEPGQGTCVTVVLPSAVEECDETGDEPAGGVVPGGSILVMDDDESIRKLAVDILGGLGYTVTTCSDGEEACRLYEESGKAGRAFSLAILDLSVPDGMGGIEAARRILGFYPQARLIASSGYSNDPAIADFRAFGFCGAVAKPYSMDELAGAIRKALAAPAAG
jgi:two-component system cell cycle sensor histidine kinase/response regulator CckA